MDFEDEEFINLWYNKSGGILNNESSNRQATEREL